MPQLVVCPHCQRQLSVKDELAGKRLSCPQCKGLFVAPELEIPEAVPADPPEAIALDEPERSGFDFLSRLPVTSTPTPARSTASRPIRRGGSSKKREYRRTCQRCGTVWHSLVSREKKVKSDTACNNCDVVTCNRQEQLQAKRNLQASQSELERLRKCPNCQSSSYDEEIL
jgi:hypothetical protein